VTVIVPDASVVVKWYFQDEDLADRALALREDYIAGRCRLVLPDFAYHEVTNILSKPRSGFSASREFLDRQIGSLFALRIPSVRFRRLWFRRAIPYIFGFRLSIYDACYVALAHERKGEWVTADEIAARKLRRASFVRRLADYS
jgi:predicted nucleic acid-binding protein